jgi:biopolymer transport protein ExbD
MDNLNLILIFLILFAIFLFIKTKNRKVAKPTNVKKDELIQSYKIQMKKLLLKYQNDKNLQREEKIKLLKKINDELSMNLFFNKDEATELLKELSSLN